MKKKRVEVPGDLVMEILSKLPVKSLIRFKCVCKYWCSSFQTPHFISKNYRNNFNNHLNLLLLVRYYVKDSADDTADYMNYLSQLSTHKDELFCVKQNIHFPFIRSTSEPEFYGPCDGLLCLFSFEEDNVALWNPSTREFKLLPPSALQQQPSSPQQRCGFDSVGFGFDSKTDDYKVILFGIYTTNANDHREIKSRVELYSLKSNSWKDIALPNKDWPLRYYNFTTYIDGSVYCVALFDYWSFDYPIILSFDMANESFSTLPLPAGYNHIELNGSIYKYHFRLLEFNGSLGVIVYPRAATDIPFDLWLMNGGVWTKQLSIESVPGVESLLGSWINGEWFLGGSNDELLLFDPSTRELKKLGIHGNSHKMQLITYVESLVSINGRSEHDEGITRQPI